MDDDEGDWRAVRIKRGNYPKTAKECKEAIRDKNGFSKWFREARNKADHTDLANEMNFLYIRDDYDELLSRMKNHEIPYANTKYISGFASAAYRKTLHALELLKEYSEGATQPKRDARDEESGLPPKKKARGVVDDPLAAPKKARDENAGSARDENAGSARDENAGTARDENAGTARDENAGAYAIGVVHPQYSDDDASDDRRVNRIRGLLTTLLGVRELTKLQRDQIIDFKRIRTFREMQDEARKFVVYFIRRPERAEPYLRQVSDLLGVSIDRSYGDSSGGHGGSGGSDAPHRPTTPLGLAAGASPTEWLPDVLPFGDTDSDDSIIRAEEDGGVAHGCVSCIRQCRAHIRKALAMKALTTHIPQLPVLLTSMDEKCQFILEQGDTIGMAAFYNLVVRKALDLVIDRDDASTTYHYIVRACLEFDKGLIFANRDML